MGKRIVLMVGSVLAAVLLIVGVAAAAGGPAPSDEPSTSSSLEATDTTLEATDTTLEQTTTTAVITDTIVVAGEDTTTTELEDGDDSSATHPTNFGGTISSLRHAGDHTPAAVVKGKTVPGWAKKHPQTTTTTTVEVPQG